MSALAFRFISGKYQGGEFPIPGAGEVIIGRASDLDLVLVEDMVSRKHAKMVAQDGQLTITDLGSTNGTFVNGEKVRRAELHCNDRILIGTSILKIIDSADMTVAADADFREMLEDIGSRSDQNSTMSGELEEVPLPDLLQLFATNKKSGILSISGQRRGKIYIKNGQLQFAVIGGENSMSPMKALCRMAGWDAGHFAMEDWDGNGDFSDSFSESTESILMEALRQHDELQRLLPEMPNMDSVVALCVPMAPKLSVLSAGELDTLQTAINFATVKGILDKALSTDHEAMRNLHKLLKEGYLEVEM